MLTRAELMPGYVPEFIAQAPVYESIFEVQGPEFDQFRSNTDDVLDQFFIQTATWGLARWEKELGLPVNDEVVGDEGDAEDYVSDAERKAKILAALRGIGVCNLAMVHRIIQSFTGTETSCYETDTFRAGISRVGEPVYDTTYPFTIRRKFVFVAGVSGAGDEVWDEDYEATLMVNVTDFFRAEYSKAGDAVYELDPDYAYLESGKLVDKKALRRALEKVLPARVRLIIN